MQQFIAILPVILGNIGKRLGSSLVTVIGVAGVVCVLVSILAMAQGMHRTLAATGRPDRAIILAKGAVTESSSTIPRDAAESAIESAGIHKGPDGKPIASREMLAQLRLPQRGGALGLVSVRGIDALAPLRPEIRLLHGRMFRSGVQELIVGRALLDRFPGLEVGKTVIVERSAWTITGSFESAGDAHESEVLGDATSLLSAYHRGSFQSITVALDGPAALAQLTASLDANSSLGLEAHREDQFYAARSQIVIRVLTIIGIFVGSIMAIGAVFAALNTMYTAVAQQAGLIATLRAIGFNAMPVLAAVFTEALLLALTGAILGLLVAALLFGGYSASAASNQAQIIFTIRISPSLIVQGIAWSLVIGMLGGILPAIRAARLPVAQALRDL